MNCALMFIIRNDYEIKWLRTLLQVLLQVQPCNVMFKVICDIMAQLEQCNLMLKVISDIMTHWYMWITIVIAINLCNAKKMIFALIFIISNYHGINCLSSLLQVEPCNVMFKVISDIMAHCYNMWNTNVIALENENDCIFMLS